jgi:hypothetical protein
MGAMIGSPMQHRDKPGDGRFATVGALNRAHLGCRHSQDPRCAAQGTFHAPPYFSVMQMSFR